MLTREDTFDTDMKALWEARWPIVPAHLPGVRNGHQAQWVSHGEDWRNGASGHEKAMVFERFRAEEGLFHRCWQSGPGESEALRPIQAQAMLRFRNRWRLDDRPKCHE